MSTACFEFSDDCGLRCQTCARRLRRALERVSGIEDIRMSVKHQRLCIAFNPVLLESDAIGELLAELEYVVLPCRCER